MTEVGTKWVFGRGRSCQIRSLDDVKTGRTINSFTQWEIWVSLGAIIALQIVDKFILTSLYPYFYKNGENACWDELEPGDLEISYSNTVEEAFKSEQASRRQSQAIEIQVTRMNFRQKMQSRNVFHPISDQH